MLLGFEDIDEVSKDRNVLDDVGMDEMIEEEDQMDWLESINFIYFILINSSKLIIFIRS